MPSVLVVDDSKIDRLRTGNLLKNRVDVEVAYAENGLKALEVMKRATPVVLLTDLKMPNMDGLELTEAVRDTYPNVPVVLMTAHGSEDVAADAIRRGAASYVPKKFLTRDLVDIVERLLSVAQADHEQRSVFGAIQHTSTEYVLGNDPAAAEPLAAHLRRELYQMGICGENESMRVAVALDESLTNAIYHGNLEVDSAVRDEKDGGARFTAAIRERALSPPWCARRVRVTSKLTPEEAVYVIRDDGQGFDPSTLPDPTDPMNLARAYGRGLLLIRSFMDDVSHNEAGNEVTMIKRRRDGPTGD